MSELSDYRITDEDVAQYGVMAAPDRLTGTAAQNKAVFDRLIRDAVKEKYNAMLTTVGAHLVWEPYDAEKAYAPGNKVVYNGSSYLCTAACTGVSPADAAHWRMIAARGADGAGAGDMRAEYYDPRGLETDVFAYVDERTDTYDKAETLSGAARRVLELSDDTMPADAFVACVLLSKEACLVRVQVTVEGSPAVEGVVVEGLRTAGGATPVYTGADGVAIGLADTVSTTIKTRDYLDLPSASAEISTPVGAIVDAALALSFSESSEAEIKTSGSYYFSPYISDYDACAVGGGGSGGNFYKSGSNRAGGGGGGGGFVENVYNVLPPEDQLLEVTVGAGGGGSTSIKNVITANGGTNGGGGKEGPVAGTGGTGNGNGGRGGATNSPVVVPRAGEAGSGSKFDDGVTWFGGGGGGGFNEYSGQSGGAPYGGAGGMEKAGEAGKWYGGGGGGGYAGTYTYSGGRGYQGVVFLRWRYAA